MNQNATKTKRKGLFFSTGGIHLATMLGMIMQLQSRIQNPDVTGGISAGALLASIIATHGVADGIRVMAKHTKDSLLENRHGFFNTIISLLLNESLLKTDKLQALAKQLLQAKPLKCDLYIGYTNEDDMTYVSKKFLKGKVYDDLHLHVLASMSIPFLLPMTTVENKHFVDGGIFHALPVEAIQKEMQVSMEKNTAFDLVVLSSKPVDYHLQKYKTKRSFFPASVKASHYMKGIEAIVIHNDNLLMQQLLENAKAKHGLINYSFFHLEQKHVELWDKKIPLQNYGKIKKSDVEELVELGKSIVSNALKLHLKF